VVPRETDDRTTDSPTFLPRQFSNYLGLEAQASVLRFMTRCSYPGLFQTADARRADHCVSASNDDPETIDRWVETDLTRQGAPDRGSHTGVLGNPGEAALRCSIRRRKRS